MAQDKPPNVALNLDTLEREGVPREPFCTVAGGKPYVLADPSELKWDVLIAVASNPASFVRAAVPEDKAEAFAAAIGVMPAWKVNRLAAAYREHYGLANGPESPASPA